MAMGRKGDRQGDLIVTWAGVLRSPGRVFYDRLQEMLVADGFDRLAETACQPCCTAKMGAPSVSRRRYFRMHRVGYFEVIASEGGLAWRCSDSLALRDFLRLESGEKVPDHSWLSKTRGRLPHKVHERVFWVLKLAAEQGLVRGERIGVDASIEVNAARRTIVRREDGRNYREMLMQMAGESGIDTPMADDLVRIDCAPKGKKLPSEERTSKTDREAKIAKPKDGRTHLAYKPEHAIDLDIGVIVAAALHPADSGDTTTIQGTLAAEKNPTQISAAPTKDEPSGLAADKGYHSRAVLKALNGGARKARIAEPKQPGFSRWHGDKVRAVVYANRTRLCSRVGERAMRRRAEIVERSFAHNLDRGGMRRTRICGRENVHKRYLVHIASHNLSILMRLLIGAGTSKEGAARTLACLFFLYAAEVMAIILVVASSDRLAAVLVTAVPPTPADQGETSATGCSRSGSLRPGSPGAPLGARRPRLGIRIRLCRAHPPAGPGRRGV